MKKSVYLFVFICLLLIGAVALADRAPVYWEVPEVIPTQAEGELETFGLTFPEDMPLAARNFVLTARAEFEVRGNVRMKTNNPYMRWYYHEDRDIGWCSVFQIYCAYHSGVKLIHYKQDVEIGPDDVISAMEGRVGNVYYAFEEHGRWLDGTEQAVPKPGYLVIYGKRGSSGYWHIAIVESVKEMGDGVYELTTVEGNLGHIVKRLNYRYDSTPERDYYNVSVIPPEEITQENCTYKLSGDDWYINGFCATW